MVGLSNQEKLESRTNVSGHEDAGGDNTLEPTNDAYNSHWYIFTENMTNFFLKLSNNFHNGSVNFHVVNMIVLARGFENSSRLYYINFIRQTGLNKKKILIIFNNDNKV